MAVEIKLKKKEQLKKDNKLTNGIYVVWLLGFTNGTLFITMFLSFYSKQVLLGLAMFLLWVITLPPLRREKFISIWKEKKRNEK